MFRAALLFAALSGAGGGRIGFDAPGGGGDADTYACVSGHDEDGDGIDDCADDCPHASDPGQADTDGDGVGDLCDPHPDEAIDHLAFFDPFIAPRAEWTKEYAATYGESASFDATARFWEAVRPFTPTPHTFYFGGHATAIGSTSQQQMSLLFIHDRAYYYCQMFQSVGSDELALTYTYDATGSDYKSDDKNREPPLVGLDVQMTVTHELPTVSCAIASDPSAVSGPIPPDFPTADQVVLEAQDYVGTFDYFLEIRSDE